mmetsp:Transcript_57443/g.122205  ORF Transcript_57443/g.122205 Transcript_57443/m.122205 type:complete len:87 (-) Transcript_57443:1737-1997(-)
MSSNMILARVNLEDHGRISSWAREQNEARASFPQQGEAAGTPPRNAVRLSEKHTYVSWPKWEPTSTRSMPAIPAMHNKKRNKLLQK